MTLSGFVIKNAFRNKRRAALFVLSVAAAAWFTVFVLVNILLSLASRDEPKAQPDWIDSMKASLSDFAALRER